MAESEIRGRVRVWSRKIENQGHSTCDRSPSAGVSAQGQYTYFKTHYNYLIKIMKILSR